MSSPDKRSPWLWFLLWFFCIGIVLIITLLALLSRGINLSDFRPGFSPTSTTIQYGFIQNGTDTATPFQPLPTDTSTPTPTSTFTLTPTPTNTPTPTDTPTPTNTITPLPTNTPIGGIPTKASVYGVLGHNQSHTLSCESRSAVDWAAFYGITLDEDYFQSNLPTSDNPETGFVGSVDDARGQIPPNSYGVHAEPVAALLRQNGVSALAVKAISFDDLRRQIASGNPVIVWVIASVESGTPVSYTASDGSTTVVAKYEHTVILIGYDENNVLVVDGNTTYWRSISAFKSSFAVLGNMAIVHP